MMGQEAACMLASMGHSVGCMWAVCLSWTAPALPLLDSSGSGALEAASCPDGARTQLVLGPCPNSEAEYGLQAAAEQPQRLERIAFRIARMAERGSGPSQQ